MDGKGNLQFCNDVIAGAPLLAALANALGRAQRESGLGSQQRQSGDRGRAVSDNLSHSDIQEQFRDRSSPEIVTAAYIYI